MSMSKLANKKMKILIVEDEAAIRQMYEFKLARAGFVVKTAASGEQGLATAREFEPDLILLDLRLPVMDGGEMLGKLRATNWGANINVVILTNISRAEAPKALQFLAVDRYVVKAHTTPAQIVSIVNEVLRQKAGKV